MHMLNTQIRAVSLILIAVVLVGCGLYVPASVPTPTPVPLLATPFVIVETMDGDVRLEFGINVANPSEVNTESHPFVGNWRLTDENGELIAEDFADAIPPQTEGASGNARYLDPWMGRLEPGTYEVVWGAPGYGFDHTTFTLTRDADRLILTRVKSMLSH